MKFQSLLVFLSLLVMFLILVSDGYPFFIKQRRFGLHGNHFNMLKFRTMKKDSHKLRDSLANLNKGKGPLFKIEDDPRIIKKLKFKVLQLFGRLLTGMKEKLLI